jgi:hypothetical protein
LPSSLGLLGDLDDVVLVEDIEAAFGYRFADDEIANCWTVGHLFELVENRLSPDNMRGSCASTVCFYRLRRALQQFSDVKLTPNTPITDLRGLSVRKLHQIIAEQCGLRPPPSVLTAWGCAAAISLLALPFASIALELPWWIAGFSPLVAYAAYRSAPIGLPEGIGTLGDLTNEVASRSIGTLAKHGARLNRSEAWIAFKDILSDHSELPKDQILSETLILKPTKS